MTANAINQEVNVNIELYSFNFGHESTVTLHSSYIGNNCTITTNYGTYKSDYFYASGQYRIPLPNIEDFGNISSMSSCTVDFINKPNGGFEKFEFKTTKNYSKCRITSTYYNGLLKKSGNSYYIWLASEQYDQSSIHLYCDEKQLK